MSEALKANSNPALAGGFCCKLTECALGRAGLRTKVGKSCRCLKICIVGEIFLALERTGVPVWTPRLLRSH